MDVVHEKDQNRFVLSLAGVDEPAILRYNVKEIDGVTVYDMYSTRVPESLRGRGIAGNLVKSALATVRENGYKAIPTCPYIPVYLKRNPGDADVIQQ